MAVFGRIGNIGVTRNGITMTRARKIRYHYFSSNSTGSLCQQKFEIFLLKISVLILYQHYTLFLCLGILILPQKLRDISLLDNKLHNLNDDGKALPE